MPPLGLTDAEHLKQLIVEPLIEALRSEMRETICPLVERLNELSEHDHLQQQRLLALENRIGGVEQFKMKIAAVCSGIAIAAGIVSRTLLDWARSNVLKIR